ncbi:hypothetical protein STANM309S_01279 [Streptomyces tanashiensis]
MRPDQGLHHDRVADQQQPVVQQLQIERDRGDRPVDDDHLERDGLREAGPAGDPEPPFEPGQRVPRDDPSDLLGPFARGPHARSRQLQERLGDRAARGRDRVVEGQQLVPGGGGQPGECRTDAPRTPDRPPGGPLSLGRGPVHRRTGEHHGARALCHR